MVAPESSISFAPSGAQDLITCRPKGRRSTRVTYRHRGLGVTVPRPEHGRDAVDGVAVTGVATEVPGHDAQEFQVVCLWFSSDH